MTYTVANAPTLSSSPRSLFFLAGTDQAPAAQQLSLSISSGAPSWTSQTDYTGGATTNWLTLTPASGSFPATAAPSVSVGAVSTAGTYTAEVVFSAGGSGASTTTVPVEAHRHRPGRDVRRALRRSRRTRG